MRKRSKGRNIIRESPNSHSINVSLSENKMQTLIQGNHKHNSSLDVDPKNATFGMKINLQYDLQPQTEQDISKEISQL